MRNRLGVVLGSGAIALMAGMGTATATATTTWTITPGGALTGASGFDYMKDMTTGTNVECNSFSFAATLKRGTGLVNPLGRITSVSAGGCVGSPGRRPWTVTVSASAGNPWHLRGISYSNGVTTGRITNVALTLSAAGCSATVGGATPASAGRLSFGYSNNHGALKLLPYGDLHIWNVSGCNGLIGNGDTFAFLYINSPVSPAQTITSP
jgi:hypothetical protein